MKKPLTFILSLLLGQAAAQEIPPDSLSQEKLLNPYSAYFEFPGEGIYTHFNKSSYMTGEAVWFKIYLFDTQEKRPFDLQQNVYAELFDPNGNPVRRQVLFAEKGSAWGMIELADTLMAGTYTFRAYTNWMRNMEEGQFYTRTFRVNGGVQKIAEGPAGDGETTQGAYEIGFYPEGGQLLEGMVNTVAFKIVDPTGKGTALDGVLKNGNGDTLLKLTTNPRGMSSFPLTPAFGEKYYAEFTLPGGNGEVQTVNLPEARRQGVALSCQWFFPDKVSVLLRTNAESLQELQGKNNYVLVHNRGKVARVLIVNWTNRPVIKIDIDKALLLSGVNHVTLFNEQFEPVADRMIFISGLDRLGRVSMDSRVEADSLAFSLIATDSASEPLEADVSVSFLPGGTGSADFESSIYTTLLLESDIKGTVEDPSWYFEDENDFERIKALDHLLLTQGWRRYNWDAIQKGSRPAPVHEFEQGFTIRGEVVNSISRKEMEKSQISIFSPENGLMTVVDVDSSGTFVLPQLMLMDSTRVVINATNAKGRSGFRELNVTVTEPRFAEEGPPLPVSDPVASDKVASLVLPEGSELLEGVTVTGRKADPSDQPFAGSTYFSTINDRVVVVTKDNYFKYNTLRDLLMMEFNIVGNSMGRGGGEPVLIIDDTPMDDLSWLDMIHISEVEAVAVNKTGNAMLGQRGANGSINVKTRTRAVDWGPRRDLNIVNLLIKGFSAPVEYYAPEYAAPVTDPDFVERAALYWKPDVRTDFSGRAVFKFPLPSGVDRLHVRTQGISPAGVLISDERVINLK